MTKETEFFLDEHLEKKQKPKTVQAPSLKRFERLAEAVQGHLLQVWEQVEGQSPAAAEKLLERQNRAIIGYPSEKQFFKSQIRDFLQTNGLLREWFPDWYLNLVDGLFEEAFGLAGFDAWRRLGDSSSAKSIGERIYFMMDGRIQLMPQRITPGRLEQLITALLLSAPEKRRTDDVHEVYLLDGTRVTIYESSIAKQPAIVFRKYTVQVYTFEQQAEKRTIPEASIPLLKSMVACGFNVAFLGPVRSAKTTFLATWQSVEDPTLEGVLIETDPEIPLHRMMPDAPILQFVADGEKLRTIVKPLMRSDADYLIMAEARDGLALKIALDVTKKGTRRVKLTFHTSRAVDFCIDAATEIQLAFGGEVQMIARQIAKGYHYLFEFQSLANRSQKRLKGIWEMRVDAQGAVSVNEICRYEVVQDTWSFHMDIGEDKRALVEAENPNAFCAFREHLHKLAAAYPMEMPRVVYPLDGKEGEMALETGNDSSDHQHLLSVWR